MNITTATHPDPARASIARELAAYYSELAGFDDRPTQRFNLARAIRKAASGGLRDGYEAEVCRGADMLLGRMSPPDRLTIPLAALATRDLDATGGYLVGTRVPTAVDALRGYSVVADAGINVVENLRDDIGIPRVTGDGAGAWLAPGDALPEAQPTMGQASATPKMGGAIVKLSHEFMRMVDGSDAFVRAHLLRKAGELLDRAFFSGAGLAAPLGLYRIPDVGQQSGTSIARAGLLAMREAVLNAGAREDRLRWVGDPAAQELLAARHAVADTFSPLWADTGTILGRPAHATPTAVHVDGGTDYPALCVGDFTTARLLFWGPASIQLAIDPYNAFESGGVAVRVLLLADIVCPQPGAFAVARQLT